MTELLGTHVITTAAYFPWSNGIVKQPNAELENKVLKLTDYSKCSVANAVVWAVSAKNALHNNIRYNPNQLVFGRNTSLPSDFTAKAAALRPCTHSQLLAEHSNAFQNTWMLFTLLGQPSLPVKHQERSNLPYKSRHVMLQVSFSIYEHRCTIKEMMKKPSMDQALWLE